MLRLFRNYAGVKSFKVAILLPFLCSFLFLFNSCQTKNEPAAQSHPAKKELTETKNLQWFVVKTMPVNDGSELIDIVVTDDKKFICLTRKSLLLLNDNRWDKILSSGEGHIFDNIVIDGNLVLFSEGSDYNLPVLKYSFIISKGKSVTLTKPQIIPLPFSEYIYGIKLVARNKYILLGRSEYAVLEIVDPQKNKFMIEHYPIPGNPSSDFKFVQNQFSNEPLIYSRDAMYILDKTSGYSRLKKLFDFPDPILTPDNVDYYRAYYSDQCYGNINFGIFKKQSKFYYYEKNGNDYRVKSFPSLELSNGESISADSDYPFLVKDRQNIFCLAKGLLLKKVNDTIDFFSNNWQIVGELPEKTTIRLLKQEGDHFITGTKNVYFIEKEKNQTESYAKNSSPLFYLFYPSEFINSSSVYGCGVGNFENKSEESVFLTDIVDNNKYYPVFSGPYPSDEATTRGLVGRKITKKTENNSKELDIGVAVGDIDESGTEDIVVTNLDGPNSLYINNGNGYFRYSSEQFGLDSSMHRSEGAALADVNNDGWLDLFMTSYLSTNRMYLNHNGVKFDEITFQSGLQSKWGAISATFGDINNDGLPDLYVCYWMDDNRMYLNKGDGKFEDITESSGTSCGKLKRSNSAVFADFNNDGKLDLFVGNRGTGNKFFFNVRNGKFSDVTDKVKLGGKFLTYGAAAGDFDNNGWLDLSVTDSSGVHIFLNNGLQKDNIISFSDDSSAVYKAKYKMSGHNTGIAVYDKDVDHDLDLVMGQNGGRIFVFHNNYDLLLKKNYLEVILIGSESNRSAIGAKLRLYKDNKLIGYREVNTGSGYASCNSKTQHFGLGDLTGKFELVVEFSASKVTKKYAVSPGSVIVVHEHEGLSELKYIAHKNIIKFFSGIGLWSEIEKSLILFPFWVLMFYAAKSKKIKVLFPGYIYPDRTQFIKTVFASIVFYSFAVVIIQTYFYYFPSFNNWINNTRDAFVEDYLPFIIALVPLVLFQMFLKGRKDAGSEDSTTISRLITKISGFHHGESSAMCLNRLSLFFKNISSVELNDTELNDRILTAIHEYETVTFKEILELAELCGELSYNKKFYDFAVELKQKSRTLNKNCIMLNRTLSVIGPDISTKDLASHDVYHALSLVEKIRNEIDDLNEIIKYKITSNVGQVINLICKKFSDNNNVNIFVSEELKKNHLTVLLPTNELEKILSIIVQNAIDAFIEMKVCSSVIKIDYELATQEVILIIRDYGTGITEEDQSLIFTKGFTTKKGGNGFGLNYAKKTLKSFGGDITFESRINKGTSFIITLQKI